MSSGTPTSASINSSSLIHKPLLIAATIAVIVAQGFWIIPTRLEFTLIDPPVADTFLLAGIIFFLGMLLYVASLRPVLSSGRRIWLHVVTLLLVLPTSTFGVSFVLNRAASPPREIGFLLCATISLLTVINLYQASGSASTNGSKNEDESVKAESKDNSDSWNEQILILNRRLETEKYRNKQLIFLNELSQQLEAELEPEVAAQLTVNTLARAFDCVTVSLFLHLPEESRYESIASAGEQANSVPQNQRIEFIASALEKTLRLKKSLVVNDTNADSDLLSLAHAGIQSVIYVPVLDQNHVKGILEIASENSHTFQTADVAFAESAASQLLRAWQGFSYHQRLRELIQAGISMTTLLDPQGAVQEIAMIARKTLGARFVFVTLLDQQGNFSRTASSGEAPVLLKSLSANPVRDPIMQAALNATKPFRIRDIRKYATAGRIDIDTPALRSALAIPIRLHRLSIGTIMAFGRQEGVFFLENDVSLAGLLSSQAAASIESSWLYQELRNTLNNTSMLYQLSVDVIQAEELSKAAELIARAAHKLTSAKEAGIVLLTREGTIETEVEIDSSGLHTRNQHPRVSIDQALQTGQSIITSVENGSLVCYPLLTPGGKYGALWINIPESRGQNFANLQTFANQAAIALERSILLSESQRQARQLEAAYTELEITYDQTLTALTSALDARDRETEGHSGRVSRLACLLAKEIGMSSQQIKALERGALLHDIGKIGIKDSILHKPGKLTEEEWQAMRIHPDIGAKIVDGIPFLRETISVIRYHHERWNGSGYPLGLRGTEIPVQARIFAIADVFDALTSKRSYRKSSSAEDAVNYLQEYAGILFDPEIAEAITRLPYHELTELGSVSNEENHFSGEGVHAEDS